MKIICISDTHNLQDALNKSMPEGDILIHAGDFTSRGKLAETIEVYGWLANLDYKHIIVIPGNHDFLCQRNDKEARRIMANDKIHYLIDEEIVIDGIKFWGSPWTPFFFDWAFNIEPGKEPEQWEKIPNDVDVLITHGPPYEILDTSSYKNEHCGCKALAYKIKQIKPRFHIFGHVHEGYGVKQIDETTYINASTCNSKYHPVNKPIVFDIEPKV